MTTVTAHSSNMRKPDSKTYITQIPEQTNLQNAEDIEILIAVIHFMLEVFKAQDLPHLCHQWDCQLLSVSPLGLIGSIGIHYKSGLKVTQTLKVFSGMY